MTLLEEGGMMVDETEAPETAVEQPNDEVVKSAENDELQEEEEFQSADEYDSEDESSDEEEEEGEAGADDGDDYDLLAMAKKRMAELKAKEEAAAQKKAEGAEEESDDHEEDSEEEEGDEDEDEEDHEDKDETQEEEIHPAEETETADREAAPAQESPASAPRDADDSSVITTATAATTATSVTTAASNTAAVKPKTSPRRVTSFRAGEDRPVRRKKRDENAELWALIRQSKSRVAETKELVEKVELRKKQEAMEAADASASDLDTSMEINTNGVRNREPSKEEEKKDDDPDPEGDENSEEDLDEETKRQREFERENQELVELLAASRKRLEQAALQQARKAEAAAAKDDASPKKVENPYAQINYLPDEVEPESQEQLTQKDLLLAMAVAEEAARSGQDKFETPAREELRTRDLASFDFLKEDKKPEPVPTTPITTYKEQQHEQNRFDAIVDALMTKWAQFKKRVEEIDYLHHEQSTLSQQVKLMG